MIEKLYDQYWVVYCDNCEVELGELGEEFNSPQEARDAAKEAGWKATTISGHWENLCPDCQEV